MEKEYYITLINKYLNGTITEIEIQELNIWIKNDSQLHKWWMQELEEADESIDHLVQDSLFCKIHKSIDSKHIDSASNKKTKRIKWNFVNYMKWVAVVCIPICISVFTYLLLDSSDNDLSLTVMVDKGDRSTIILPDSTKVKLNSASMLRYPVNFGKKVRKVQLNGEAYFKVTSDASRPFIVQIGELEVKVLGTSFNICSYDDLKNITVVLLKGKISVYTESAIYLLQPDEKMVYNKQTKRAVFSKVCSTDYIEWTKGNIHVDNESLENISKMLSKRYNVSIYFDSEKLKKEHFTGTIVGGGIQNALNILMLTSPFYYEFNGSAIILKEK